MSCHCCQKARILLRAVWTDGGSELNETQLIVDHGTEEWVDFMEPGDVGLLINGGLIARGPNPEIPGDTGYTMAISLRNVGHPVPMKVVWEVWQVEVGEDDILVATREVVLHGVGGTVEDLPEPVPGEHIGLWWRNGRILFADQIL